MTRFRSVGALLLAHEPADDVEARHRADMLALLAAGGDPFSRHCYHPGHFTASAVVLAPDGSSLLLVHHRKLGFWVQPGGHIDLGDKDVPAAAAREVGEEAGVTGLEPLGDSLFDVDVHTFRAHGDQPTHLHFDLRFLFRAPTADLRPGPEVAGARWVPLDEIGVTAGDASLARSVRKLRGDRPSLSCPDAERRRAAGDRRRPVRS